MISVTYLDTWQTKHTFDNIYWYNGWSCFARYIPRQARHDCLTCSHLY